MARFRYRMQGILDIKLKMETQARQEFAQAKLLLDKEEERMVTLQEKMHMYEEQAMTLLNGRLDLQEIVANKEAIIHTEEAIVEQQLCIDAAKAKVEEVREKLTNVMQERKVHETLKDKAFETFLLEEKQQESKEIDELTSYQYGQKLLEAEETDVEDIGDGSEKRS